MRTRFVIAVAVAVLLATVSPVAAMVEVLSHHGMVCVWRSQRLTTSNRSLRT